MQTARLPINVRGNEGAPADTSLLLLTDRSENPRESAHRGNPARAR